MEANINKMGEAGAEKKTYLSRASSYVEGKKITWKQAEDRL